MRRTKFEMSICDKLACVTHGGVTPPKLLVVFAHPDDEVLAVGGRLEWLRESRFLCVTDGVPLDGKDAHDHGFAGLDEYRIARRQELLAVFRRAGEDGAAGVGGVWLHSDPEASVPDQTASFQLPELTRRFAAEIRRVGPEAVLTHPYEGGHPDHDACAFAVHAAVRLLGSEVPIIEAPFYHAGPHGVETGRFLPGGPAASVGELSPSEQQHKRERLACFVSQRETLALFGTEREQYRPAPAYDFTKRPHDGSLHYEGFPWGMSGDRFCELAAASLQGLGLRASR